MAHVSVRLLGPMEVTIDGEPVAFATNKVRALLAFLAVEAGRPHRRESLAALLWAGQPERAARASLRRALADLRRAIGDDDRVPPALQVTRQSIGFDPSSDVEVDVRDFLASAGGEATTDQLDNAVRRYGGTFLEGFSVPDTPEFDEWSLLQRERLQREMSDALGRLIELLEVEGDLDRALDRAWRRVEVDRWHEGARRQVMRLLALTGQRSAALAQYETMIQILADELGVDPEPESRQLCDQIRDGDLASLDATVAGATRSWRAVGECPYRGLAAFREADAPLFFGRDEFVERVARSVERRPVTVVVGPSGSGKTSAVFAGLVPQLREGRLVIDLRPGPHPFHALAAALLVALEPDRGETALLVESRSLATALATGDVPVADVLSRLVHGGRCPGGLLLVVDQTEELYTLGAEPDLQRRFMEQLLDDAAATHASATSSSSGVSLLLTLRADFMGHALAHRLVADAFQDSVVMLGPMSRDEVRAAIERPAELRGAEFEAGLVERLLDDVVDEPGGLPLLEFALTLLWERHERGWLTHAAYDGIGRVDGALANYADQVFELLDDGQRHRARFVFEQLVRPGEGTDDTRRIAVRSELSDEDWALVQHLADERLVVTGRDAAGHETVEVVHEALIQRWGRLRSWMESDRAFRVWQEAVRAASRAWDASDRDDGALLRGGPLTEAETWAGEHGDELSDAERGYIEASIALRDRHIAERERRRRRTMLTLGAGLVVAIVLAGIALSARSDARREADVNRSLVLATEAEDAAQRGEPDLAVALALEAVAIDDAPAEVRRALSVVAQARGTRAVLRGHSDVVRSAAVSPDVDTVVSGSCGEVGADGECTSGEVIVWDLETGDESARLDGHDGWVNDVAFADDTNVLTASDDGSIMLWDLTSGDSVRRFQGHQGGVTAVAVDPSGTTALSGSDDTTLILWDVTSGDQIQRLEGHRAGITRVAFGPGSDVEGPSVAVSAANDSTVMLWDLETGEAVRVFEGHQGAVTGVVVGRDGETILSLSEDLTLREWDIATGAELRRHSFGATPRSLAIRPGDGSVFASVKTDVRVWDVERWQEDGRLSGHVAEANLGAEIGAIAIDPLGRVAVSAGFDRTVRVWNLAGQVAQRRLDTGGLAMEAVEVSRDGSRLVTGMGSGEMVIWDAAGGREMARLGGEGIGVAPACVSLGPDDSRSLVCAEDPTTASEATSLVLWDLDTGRELRRFDGHVTKVRAAQILPDGRRALSGSQSIPDSTLGDLVLWDLATGEEIRRFDHDHDVTNIEVSADGSQALTGSAAAFVAILWDVATGEEIRRFEGHAAPVLNVAFGPDEATVMTASYDGILVRWDIATGDVVQRYEGHEADVWGLDISPDGRSMISSSADGGVIVWDLATGDVRHRLEAHRSYVFDVAFGADGNTVYSAGLDGLLIEWQGVDMSLDEMQEWIRANRYVRDLTCDEREQYRLDTDGCSSTEDVG